MSSAPPPPPPYVPPGVPPPQFPHFPPPRRRAAGGDVALKLLIGSAVGAGVGFGTCGLGAVFSGTNQKATQMVIGLGAFVFFASLLMLMVSAVWLLIAAIVGGSRR
jgi:hypothetical protein